MLPKYWLGSVVAVAVLASASPALAQPVVTASPHDFGSVRVTNAAVTTADHVFSIRNDGDADLVISSFALAGTDAGDFAIIAAPATPATVAPSTGVDVTVRFNPTAPDARAATLDIASNAAMAVTSVALTGTGTSALIAVTDADFMIVGHGTTASRNLSVSNEALAPRGPLHVTSASISGGSWFTFGTNGPSNCAGLTTCNFAGGGFDVTNMPNNVSVRCSPPANASGTQTATVTFTSDSDAGGDDTAMLTCTAGRADLTFTPSLAFGDVFVNPMTPPSLTVTIGNTGNQNLVFTAAKSGTAGLTALYTLGGCFSACPVLPGTSEQFTVTFDPTAPTNPDANISITVTSNDPDDGNVSIPVTARGVAPDLTAPMTLALGNVEVGKTSTIQTLTVMNTGTAPLTITDASFAAGAADYTALAGTLGAQLTMIPVGGSTTWDLVCNPQGQGSRPGTFRIASNSFMEATVDVGLTCTGQQGALVVSVAPSGTTIDFGSVPQDTVVTRAFTLRNTGNLPVTGIAAAVNPANQGYSIDPSTPVPTTLAAGASASLLARFAPTAATDGGAATVTFTGDWGTTPTQTTAVLTLAGVTLTTGFALDPAAIDFGDLRFDTTPTRTFCISNTGQAAVTIQSPIAITPGMGTMTGEFTVTTIRRQTTCGTGGSIVTLPQTLTGAAEVLQVTVQADPANRTGAMQATLTVTSNLGANPTRTLALAGNSTSAAITVAPAPTIDFGPVDVQGTAVTQMFTITNTGDGPLDLGSFSRNADPEFTITLPAGVTTLPPAGMITIPVTYKPIIASSATSPEVVTISHSIAGVLNGPSGGMLVVRGYGIDRVLELVASPAFPDTFRNPGDQAPERSMTIRNKGEALLKVSAVMITNDPDVWQLLDPDPVDLAKDATHDFRVRFSPKRAGRAPDAKLRIVNDDSDRPMFDIDLIGNGLDRNVLFAPDTIRLGFTGVGVPVTLDDALVVTNIDAQNAFRIRSIELEQGPFAIGGTTTDVALPANGTLSFSVTFTPDAQGPFAVKARLFLDMDPESQHEVTIEGTAVFVDAHGGGGCSTGGAGGGAGGVALVLAALLGRRRRRRRPLAAAALALPIALAPAAASADNIVLSVFDPVPATASNGFQLQSPEVGASGDWAFSAVGSLATDPLILNGIANGASVNDHAVISRSTLIDLGGAVRVPRPVRGRRAAPDLHAGRPGGRRSADHVHGRPRHRHARPATSPCTARCGCGARPSRATARSPAAPASSSRCRRRPTAGSPASTRRRCARCSSTSLVPGAFQDRITLSANVGGVFRAPLDLREPRAEERRRVGPRRDRPRARSAVARRRGVRRPGALRPHRRDAADARAVADRVARRPAVEARSPDHRRARRRPRPHQRRRHPGLPRRARADLRARRAGPAADQPAAEDRRRRRRRRRPRQRRSLPERARGQGPATTTPTAAPTSTTTTTASPTRRTSARSRPRTRTAFEDDDGCPDKDNDGDGIPDTLDKCPMQRRGQGRLPGRRRLPRPRQRPRRHPRRRRQVPGRARDDQRQAGRRRLPRQGRLGDRALPGSPRDPRLDPVHREPQGREGEHEPARPDRRDAARAHRDRPPADHGARPADRRRRQDQEISDKRAAAVREWLVQWGIDAARARGARLRRHQAAGPAGSQAAPPRSTSASS